MTIKEMAVGEEFFTTDSAIGQDFDKGVWLNPHNVVVEHCSWDYDAPRIKRCEEGYIVVISSRKAIKLRDSTHNLPITAIYIYRRNEQRPPMYRLKWDDLLKECEE